MNEDIDINLEEATVDMGLSGYNNLNNSPTIENASPHPENHRKKIIIWSCIGGGILLGLLALILGLLLFSGRSEKDDQLILPNVYAAGVNLGGMSIEEAISALHVATDHEISQQPMEVTIYGQKLVLEPSTVSLSLDVDALAQAAYNYGRSGTHAENQQIQKNAANRSYTIPLLPYLNLDLQVIRSKVDNYCASVTSSYAEPIVELSEDKDSLEITLGTPLRQLDADDLYDRILDAYSMNTLSFEYEAPEVLWPSTVNAQELFDLYCTAPQDAVMDPKTYSVIPETDGFGFNVDDLQQALDDAQQQLSDLKKVDPIVVEMTVLRAAIRAENLNEELFSQTLAECIIPSTETDEARNNNIQLSCDAISGYIVKPGETFSFMDVLGSVTEKSGYKEAKICSVNNLVMGGGISQTASALYHCILHSDLEIIEHHSHEFAPDFVDLGLDAYVFSDSKDLRFRNNTNSPICIEASFSRNSVSVSLIGSAAPTYKISISSEIISTLTPNSSTQMFLPGNVQGYADGDVIVEGIEGYKVSVYKEKYDPSTNSLKATESVTILEYNKRDEVIASIGVFVENDTKDPEQSDQGELPENTETPENPNQTDPSVNSEETT